MSIKLKMTLIGVAAVAILLGCFVLNRLRKNSCCVCELEQIEGAKQFWAEMYHKTTNDVPTLDDLQPIVFAGRTNLALVFVCPSGGTYTIGRVGERPRCSIGGQNHTLP